MTVFDWDDHGEQNSALPYMMWLKELNPAFRATLFCPLTWSSDTHIESLPKWLEIVPHGFEHGDPPSDGGECRGWTYEDMSDVMDEVEERSPRWARGFKAPGWQISDECYQALKDRSWWVADQHLEDSRRPPGMSVYYYEDDGNWHGHVQNVCSNGLQETWPTVCERVRTTVEFRFASAAVKVAVG